jgi:hypothetical protein
MPAQILELFDLSFELLNRESKEAYNRLADFERGFPRLQYYATALRYIAADFSSAEEVRVKRAKKALLDSIEHFCLEELKKRP